MWLKFLCMWRFGRVTQLSIHWARHSLYLLGNLHVIMYLRGPCSLFLFLDSCLILKHPYLYGYEECKSQSIRRTVSLFCTAFGTACYFSEVWAMADGIEVPENMRRSMCNNFSLLGFWRSWHASFNRWLVRYLHLRLYIRNDQAGTPYPKRSTTTIKALRTSV